LKAPRVVQVKIQAEEEPYSFFRDVLCFLLHLLCLLASLVYLLPVLSPFKLNRRDPVFDELHILSPENKDINGESTLRTIFTKDYWGRPMNAPSSHKSWRPLTVLCFRYLKGGRLRSRLTAYRIVNILTHACVAELVSIPHGDSNNFLVYLLLHNSKTTDPFFSLGGFRRCGRGKRRYQNLFLFLRRLTNREPIW
jgi:hypothetical protein